MSLIGNYDDKTHGCPRCDRWYVSDEWSYCPDCGAKLMKGDYVSLDL